MSDTPETDDQSIIYAINDNGYQVPCVDLEFARKLERERDEWRNKFELSVDAVEIAARAARAESERDEARQQYDDLATEHMLAVNKLAEERDEARADAARIADILSGLELRTTEELAKLERERDEALMDRANGDMATMTINHYERLIKERDEERELAQQMSESNQVLMADVRFYRNAWEQLKEAAK
jgi:hypothetical protein